MVEVVLSFALLIGALSVAVWPWAVIHDHSVDGLFLTLTGSVLALIFLSHLVWHLRLEYAESVAQALRSWRRKRAHAGDALWSTGGADMKTAVSKARIVILLAVVLVLALAFPGKLYATDVPVVRHSSRAIVSNGVFANPINIPARNRETPYRGDPEPKPVLMDGDTRVRAATTLMGDPVIKRLARGARVPIRVIVITAPVILDV